MGQLTDEGMKKMMPLFVEDTDPPDHKCGSCFMRIPTGGDVGLCTVKAGPINMANGTCLYWTKGKASAMDDAHPMRMDNATSGYVTSDGKIQCGTCKSMKGGMCELWMGTVKAAQCCISWTA